MKIGTYTADTIKIIGMMVIYLIHPDSKQPTQMTFHIASSKGSVLPILQHFTATWPHTSQT